MEEVSLLKYEQVLDEIQDKENHLLIGNGFNRGLGVNTSYDNIFKEMMNNNYELYKDAQALVKESEYDLECFIGKLIEDINPENKFLIKYVNNKVKLDFMQATHDIVKAELKNVYAEKNKGIYLLLKNFSNYFTLNYDSFLYLLLMNFKSSANANRISIAFQLSMDFIEEDMNINQNNIYKEIKNARINGNLKLSLGDNNSFTETPFNRLSKTHLEKEINHYSKINSKGWSNKDISKVIGVILEEEKENDILENIDDGCIMTLFGNEPKYKFYIESKTQNLFFLHGAFHIYKDGQSIKKITQSSNKALYQRLEEILNSEEKEIVCIFQSEDKETAINENPYLCKCLSKLGELSGNMVIIGSSLADNDNHIFEQINNSKIDTLYISTLSKSKDSTYEIASTKFPSKTIHLFDAESISYKLPENTDNTPKQKRRGK